MNIFTIFFFTKLLQNTLQNASNCTILKKFLEGAYAPEPPSIQVASPRSAWHKALCK